MFPGRRLLRLALVLTLLLMQGLASAHDLDHALGQHDNHCALHVLASHSPGTPSAPPVLVAPRTVSITQHIIPAATPVAAFASPFSARAPPVLT